jgi:hypothetical protein
VLTSIGIEASVLIVVPPLKSIPKFKPKRKKRNKATIIPIIEAPKVIFDNLKKSTLVSEGTSFNRIINL